jgi:hypothetical protein
MQELPNQNKRPLPLPPLPLAGEGWGEGCPPAPARSVPAESGSKTARSGETGEGWGEGSPLEGEGFMTKQGTSPQLSEQLPCFFLLLGCAFFQHFLQDIPRTFHITHVGVSSGQIQLGRNFLTAVIIRQIGGRHLC